MHQLARFVFCVMEAYRILPIALVLSALSFIISYLLTPLTARLSYATGALDRPDGVRKIHLTDTPRLGGLAFFFAAFISVSLLALHEGINIALGEGGFISALLSGGAILCASGVLDDTFGLAPLGKLLLQSAAALVALVFLPLPESVSFFGLVRVPLIGPLGYIFMLIRMILTVNAVNFSDGLDGLASGLSLVALLSLFVFGLANGRTLGACVSLILAAAVLGFLPYNRYRARLYMGDVGSQFLGLSIAIIALSTTRDGSFTLETSLFLFIPMLDTFLSVVRRLLHGRSPFSADKGHLHHLLLARGRSHPAAVRTLVSISALVALLTLALCLP